MSKWRAQNLPEQGMQKSRMRTGLGYTRILQDVLTEVLSARDAQLVDAFSNNVGHIGVPPELLT